MSDDIVSRCPPENVRSRRAQSTSRAAWRTSRPPRFPNGKRASGCAAALSSGSLLLLLSFLRQSVPRLVSDDVRCCFWFLICVQVWRRVKPIHRIWLVFIASYCYKIIVNRMARRRTLAVRAHKPTKTPTRNVTDHRSNHESIMYAPTHSWSHSPFATLEPSFTRTDQYLPSPS